MMGEDNDLEMITQEDRYQQYLPDLITYHSSTQTTEAGQQPSIYSVARVVLLAEYLQNL